MNEKMLNGLILEGMRQGKISLELTDAIVDQWLLEETAADQKFSTLGIRSKLKKKVQDAAIERSVRSLETTALPPGHLLANIRTSAGLSLSDIAMRLGRQPEYVQQAEAGGSLFLKIAPEEFVAIMELFRLSFRSLKAAVDSVFVFGPFRNLGAEIAGMRGESENRKLFPIPTPGLIGSHLDTPSADRSIAETWLTAVHDELQRRELTELLE